MQIQRIEFPVKNENVREQMYLRCMAGSYRVENDTVLVAEKSTHIRFNTYFNALSIEKWQRYTILKDLSFVYSAAGKGSIKIWNAWRRKDGTLERELLTESPFDAEPETMKAYQAAVPIENFCEPKRRLQGILYAELVTGQQTGCVFADGAFCTSTEAGRQISLALAICTYKREEYICHNLEIIKKSLTENSRSPLFHKLDVIVVDNGKTLETERQENWLFIYPNRNAGGTAGFTRGMQEVVAREKYTHVLLMDDDVEIKPSALEKTYVLLSLLREEYWACPIGGAMLRRDYSFIQQEAGACYRNGRIEALRSGIDLRKEDEVICNEREAEADYNAWWYCCIPVSVIQRRGFPLPLFIHEDDVEYGLRMGAGPLRMNGICVWHEAFEHKRPSANEYYDVRNTLIVNAIYVKDYGSVQAFRMVLRRMLVNLFRYRYRDMELVARAVEDFLRGPAWLMQTDAESLHREVIDAGYRYTESFDGLLEKQVKKSIGDILAGKSNSSQIEKRKLLSLNGWLLPAARGEITPIMAGESPHRYYRKKRVWIYDPDTEKGFYTGKEGMQLLCFIKHAACIYMQLKKGYTKVQMAYQNKMEQMSSGVFWNEYLKERGEEK